MNNLTSILAAFILLLSSFAHAQNPVNAYARVTAISGTVLTLSNVNETFDTYENGEKVIIMQVQDNVLGNATTNAANFGNMNNLLAAGLFEIATIATHTEVAGVPATITLTGAPTHLYNTGANSRVQVISFPRLGNNNFTTTADISGLAWNGNIGGAVAFEVTGTLTLNHNIVADGLGFRGGAKSVDYSGPTNCSSSNIYISSSNEYGAKGEGIFVNTNANYNTARSRILTGGGGGSHHNAGGGGGGNFSAGGEGGPGYNATATGCTTAPAGGLGGLSLAGQINFSRLFLGGGGGGGQQNNSVGTNGGNGGGFIYIKANQLTTSGTCANRRISANGVSAANSGNDGAGGGGAGGSILINIPNFNILSACPLRVQANGGNGGSATNSVTHAGGGGGGQGNVLYAFGQPSTNVITTTSNGLGGCNDLGCTSRAIAGQGANNLGVMDNMQLLAVELASLDASVLEAEKAVLLNWVTKSESNNEFFALERSADAVNFETIYEVLGAGTSSEMHSYQYTDRQPLAGTSYYRLRQTDFDGKEDYSTIVAVELPFTTGNVVAYPNPARDMITLSSDIQAEDFSFEMFSVTGATVIANSQKNQDKITIETADLPRGVYVLRVKLADTVKTMKIVLE